MATVNFSVPEDVKEAFNRTFEGKNKSAVIVELMRRAIEEARRQQSRKAAIDRLTRRRRDRPVASPAAVRKAREAGRR